ncbi:maleylpyruvate isomerase family mycothiol-dependent enzyme [Streptomyces sp. NA04227]|uniref:maleylpyruvate isomerase family mycothiol-dependent enzyme n=1 Tax=Streptomyces sp. NA04227 TaxID=2742136 RepID=UPI0015914A34|nr:maleylpyruvate isomerase family mycothiol-dependent enzyme [Streptomyces sp. NA04227]QKW06194.1 maleylpyruvate isomerase family mycothiol-dependent enzyme [Streptomyces sp. NA04227]
MRTRQDSLAWAAEGTSLVRKALAGLDAQAYEAPTPLPGWTRKHLVAHLAANAEALGNLVHWARTGERTPMYRSPEQRAADIESGATLSADRLASWFEESAQQLADAMGELTEQQWQAEVVTAQGRTVLASETPWIRSREVMVHAVDLGTAVTFADLPAPFLAALSADIRAKRGSDQVPAVQGDPAEVAAYLAGRPYTGVTTADGVPAEPLSAWL